MTTKNTNTASRQEERSNAPAFVVKQRVGYGKQASYERLGVAWQNEDGSIYIRLHGKQIIEGGFTLYAISNADTTA